MKKALHIAAALCVSGWLGLPVAAQETSQTTEGGPYFGGPDAVENLLRDDAAVDRPTLFERWFEWKDGLTEKHGFSFSVDYSAAFLGANESPGDDRASSGMVRFFGSWDLVGLGTKNTGTFVWKVEHRHAYTDIAPSGFGFNLGYIGLIEPPFSDQGARLTNLYWRQRLAGGRVTLLGGFLDATDYVDVYALASPWTGFLNFAFYEYFKHVEIGWTTAQDRIYLDNVHLTLWHADERIEAAQPSGWGANLSWTAYLDGKWLPFVRAGYADDGGSLTQKSVSVGFGYQPNPGANLLGFGVNRGQPNEDTWGPGLDDQYTAELFYRWQISKAIAVTPDLQYIRNPALDPDANSIWVFGLRVRGAL
jgi:porin